MDTANAASLGDFGWQCFPREFHEYILSNSALLASYPFLKTCSTISAHRVPSGKVRVSALTESSYGTIIVSGTFTISSADAQPISGATAVPGSTMNAPAAPSTNLVPDQAMSSSNTPVEVLHTPLAPHSSLIALSPPRASCKSFE